MSRGLANNNPGNIRHDKSKWMGEVQPSTDKSFKQFQSRGYGYRAMFVLIYNYIGTYKTDSIKKIISRYAPPNENNTQAYIDTVCKRSGLNQDELILKTDGAKLAKIISAMSFVENGLPAIESEVTEGLKLAKERFKDIK